MIIFETKRLLVRQYEPTDGDNFFSLNGNQDVMRYIRPAKSREESDAFLKYNISLAAKTPQYGRWAVIEKESGCFVGSFAVIEVDDRDDMQLGYALLPFAWGKGYATELTVAGIAYVFTKTALQTIYAFTEGPNLPSQKVLLKAGFIQTGSKTENGKELLEFAFTKKQYAKLTSGSPIQAL